MAMCMAVRTRHLLALGLVLLLTATLLASDADEKGRLIAFENAWNQAQVLKDVAALEKLTADGFLYTDTDGTVMDKAAFLKDTKDPAYRAISAANEDVVVQLHGGTAIVIGRYHTKGTYKGKPFDHHGRFTDTWVQRGEKWLCVASHTSLLAK